jgi:hypothetical protein
MPVSLLRRLKSWQKHACAAHLRVVITKIISLAHRAGAASAQGLISQVAPLHCAALQLQVRSWYSSSEARWPAGKPVCTRSRSKLYRRTAFWRSRALGARRTVRWLGWRAAAHAQGGGAAAHSDGIWDQSALRSVASVIDLSTPCQHAITAYRRRVRGQR